MAPKGLTNREIALRAGRRLALCDPGEEIVISGLSGSYPNSDNARVFGENLMNKVDMISDDNRRWEKEHPQIPQRTGKLNEVNKFDAAFFGVHYKQAQSMDPAGRMLMEKAYEAVVDAGYNPKEFRGTNTGVFIGGCFSESEKTWFYEKIQVDGFAIMGHSRAMLANRISYWLGVEGPSYTVDSACSSSLYALEHAYKAVRDGFCNAALVGGCNLCLHPNLSLLFARLGVLSPEGKCRTFDEAANGYVRSESVCVVLVQKSKDARRIYARVVHAKSNCDGYKEQGITYPSGQIQKRLLEEFYEECDIKPSTLSYIEAHGTATKVGDPEEVKALDSVFCPGRTEPLKIGSVKSNMGHSEWGSGLCSITKVIIANETGLIPPNINFQTPKSDIEAICAGRITVVTEPTPWEGGLVGINSFGFGGANCHACLATNPKQKINNGLPDDDLPRLVPASGRTKEAVDVILNDLESRPLDAEYIRLIHEVQSIDIPGHIYRGYTLVKKEGGAPIRQNEYFPGNKHPIWFVFAGMGSQWPGMGLSLMKVPIFAESIRKSHEILTPKGVDLFRIVTSTDPKIFDNILNSFVGIAAIQIALVDILNAVGIVPDGIVGHSVGELGCAYADGCFDAEQMILSAYYRGLASLETDLIHGAMASIGIGYTAMKCMVPSDIDVACHNGPASCTISGPAESIKHYVGDLQSKGIFAREVQVSNIAYHSRYIVKAAPKLLKYLKQIIPEPKVRSKKWISSSVVEEEWDTEKAKYSSAEYHTNNLLSSVRFEEASSHIHSNAIVIEIAPHGLLQAILKRSLAESVIHVPLALRKADNVEVLLVALGRLFTAGVNFKIHELYPPIEFPVSRGTPMIAPLVRWEHSDDWYVTSYRIKEKIISGERMVTVTLKDNEMEYITGHVIDGRNLYPATGYLMLAWETVALMRGELYSGVSVVFEDVRFNRATNMPKEGSVQFTVMVQKGSGNFEIVEGGAAVVTGCIHVPEDIDKEFVNVPPCIEKDEGEDNIPITGKDIYKELRLRGYNYKGLFRSIVRANSAGNVGYISWVNNFVAFMDNLLQMKILNEDTRGLFVPTSLRKLIIDTKKHSGLLQILDKEKPEFPVYVYNKIDLIQSGGIQIIGLKASPIPRRKQLGEPVLEKYVFVPQANARPSELNDVLRICVQLVLENVPSLKVKTVELLDSMGDTEKPIISPIIAHILGDLPLIQADVVVYGSSGHPLLAEHKGSITVKDKKLPADQSASLIVASQLFSKKDLLHTVLSTLKEGGFILSRENCGEKLEPELLDLDVCLDYTVANERLLLVRKMVPTTIDPLLVKITGDSFSWIPKVKKAITMLNKTDGQKLVVYSEKEVLSGIIGLVNCLRKEPDGDDIRCVFIMDDIAPSFSVQHPFYKSQLAKNLAINVYKNGTWGSYRHILLENLNTIKTNHAYVNTLTRGDLSSLKWVQGNIDPYTYKCSDNEIIVQVYYAPLNFRDIMLATGKLSTEVTIRSRLKQDCVQGFEYAGRGMDGKRYMGMIYARTMSSVIVADTDLQWEISDEWSLEDAATIPVVYGTAMYALILKGRMKKGDSVLIHAGSGGVGQAAIHLCLFYECEIFTTVGTPEKVEFIKKTFPQIPESHIGNSRDTSFEQMIMNHTNGRGVDMVLNSLAEEKLQASIRCLANGGRFLEIGKFDLAKNNVIGLEHFLKEITFYSVMLDNTFEADKKWKMQFVDDLYKIMKLGAVKPLVRTVFAHDKVEDAFRYMAAGKHIGKVMLKLRDEERELICVPQPILLDAVPRYLCNRNGSFIVCGGLGGFGLELSDWLVLRGARCLILASRNGIRTGYQSMRIRVWRSYGVKVIVSTDDITTKEGVKKLLNLANSLGPVSAIFNLAVVLQDAIFTNQTEETFAASAGPKAVATHHLDQLSRKMCPELEQFVVFSSVVCGYGNPGQTNYGLSNSIMERICEQRKADNLPALAVEWGAVGEVGIVADMAEDNVDVVIGGTLQQRISNCLEVLDLFLKQSNPIVCSMVVAEKHAANGVEKTIVEIVVNILGLRDLKTVSLHTTLAEIGMDSMMAVEIKQSLEREFEVFLTQQDIRSLTFSKLYEISEASANNDKSKQKGAVAKNIEVTDLGMKYLIRSIGDESLATCPILRVPSLLHNGSIEEVPVSEAPTLFIIPGVEGVASTMEPLCANLNMQTLCLQYSYEEPKETIAEIAMMLLPDVLKRLPVNQPFNILGYSFGGIVALELIKLLEEQERYGRLIIIDSSPEFLYVVVKFAMLGENSHEDELQVKLLLRFMDFIWPQASSEMKNDLYKLKDWESKLDMFLSMSPDNLKYSKHYQKMLINATYLRLTSVLNYNLPTNDSLHTPTTLIRPKDVTFHMNDDYGLSQYFKSSVQIHFVEGNHFTVLENTNIAELI